MHKQDDATKLTLWYRAKGLWAQRMLQSWLRPWPASIHTKPKAREEGGGGGWGGGVKQWHGYMIDPVAALSCMANCQVAQPVESCMAQNQKGGHWMG